MKTQLEPHNRQFNLILLFALTLFFSATLMFILQPLFGKLLLPLLGGSPAVWNTCMVFYQTLLFAGYLYAHVVTTKLNSDRQIQIHTALIILSLLTLPAALPANHYPPTDSNPTLWILWTLFLAIGVPFFVVSTTAPLLQKWFSQIGHATSDDPYYLYTASNAGSLIALISYPFIIEPNIGLTVQQETWTAVYLILCLLILACAIRLWKSTPPLATSTEVTEAHDELTLNTKLHWLLLAFVPSSLLLGLTNFISTDIASVPLLWIVPLTLYLLSFVLVFSKWGTCIHPIMLFLQPVVLVPFLAYSFVNPAVLPYWLDLALHSLAFFLAIMVCHGELAKHRPATRHLTDYYLILSFGGMLGGMFNTFVAPFLFNAIYEYPIMIVAALLLRPGLNLQFLGNKKQLLLQIITPIGFLLLGLSCYGLLDNLPDYLDAIGVGLILLAGLTYAFRLQPLNFALLTGILIFFTMGLHNLMSSTLFQERTFFGVLSVREGILTNEANRPEKYRELYHGTTKHGAERLAANFEQTPLLYYSRQGPMGQLFRQFDQVNAQWSIGIVGLGAGALVCYAKNQQHWTIYEIDPLVVSIAENPSYFSYLKRCSPPELTTVIGDARLSLNKEPNQKFDLLIIDAFSSDSVPTHLITQEAMQLYFQKLKPNGLLAFHITNRHLAIKQVLADHAKQLNLAALLQEFIPYDDTPLVVATDWAVLSKSEANLNPLLQSRSGNWQKMPLYFNSKPWTDDFTNIVSIWK